MRNNLAALIGATALAALAQPATAQNESGSGDTSAQPRGSEDDKTDSPPGIIPDMPEIVVYGRGEQRIGIAAAASEGGVAGADIEVRPLLRPGELLESTPGLIATQHSGGGKANQYFLRGFNLDHGTDYALYIDDMPQNFRTHGHGQGYLDVNGLIPEIVERVDYRKGPYRADTGDFSFVGSSFITTRDTMAPFAVVEAGSYDYYRAVAGASAKLGGGDLLLAGQAKFNNGPWELPESYEGYSAFAKYSVPLGMGQLEASFNGFWATWDPTEQIPQRAVGTLIKDRYGSLDKTLTGRTERESLTLRYTDDAWKITAWAQHYDWSLLNNFTFFLDDPVNGDQRRQYDKMWGYGGRIERTFTLGDALSLRTGTELRADDIGTVGLDHTIAGVYDFTYSQFAVTETSAGVYAEAIWRPAMGLMVIGGGRGDFYRFKTTPLAGALSWGGTVKDSLFAPKIGLNYEVAPGVALYANYGEGFHSNDARGVTNPVSPAPGLVKGNFKELGGRFERGGLILTGVYWWSYIASELIYVGDSGAVEPSDPGRRRGYEVTAFWKPNAWLAIDGVWTGTHSRYVGVPAAQAFVPGALESSGELGISTVFPHWNAAVRVRYLGPHPIVEDNSVRGQSTTLVNLRAAWTPHRGQGWEVYAELLNALDSQRDDIDYYYATRFPGEPLGGVEDRNSRIVEPRQVRVGVKKTF
ncbi:TonB-dependent receptor [Croceibacterium aestuarii]|uniref:TonB-dependent receptor n=1 Tax=Croceibacterium aestuarii TaxID=3064139 RepID=UPI00272E49B3|nr:TonB-dependent receptor [Croceibacterium sp. D39]